MVMNELGPALAGAGIRIPNYFKKFVTRFNAAQKFVGSNSGFSNHIPIVVCDVASDIAVDFYRIDDG